MSLLPPDVHAELSQLLQALQSSDNSIRSQAEEHLQNNWTATRPEVLLMGLAEQIQAAGDNATRSFAAVIFRRISSKTRKTESGDNLDLFLSLAKDQAAVIRQKLLETLAAESERLIRNKISDAVAEVARQYTETGKHPPILEFFNHPLCAALANIKTTGELWPELLGALFQLSQAPEPEKRENAFRVFATTPAIIEKQHEEAVLQAFQKGFKDESVMVHHILRGNLFVPLPKCHSAANHGCRSVWQPWRLLPLSSAPLTRRARPSTTPLSLMSSTFYLRSRSRKTPTTSARPSLLLSISQNLPPRCSSLFSKISFSSASRSFRTRSWTISAVKMPSSSWLHLPTTPLLSAGRIPLTQMT